MGVSFSPRCRRRFRSFAECPEFRVRQRRCRAQRGTMPCLAHRRGWVVRHPELNQPARLPALRRRPSFSSAIPAGISTRARVRRLSRGARRAMQRCSRSSASDCSPTRATPITSRTHRADLRPRTPSWNGARSFSSTWAARQPDARRMRAARTTISACDTRRPCTCCSTRALPGPCTAWRGKSAGPVPCSRPS